VPSDNSLHETVCGLPNWELRCDFPVSGQFLACSRWGQSTDGREWWAQGLARHPCGKSKMHQVAASANASAADDQ
jgi:hypothetical protein